ncbi:MAG: S-ribosylhomocysteine lyase [Clostridia bacterium]|nr:S-ribosylhomocysteine lyase [Clostridia bacterium]
MTRIASFSVNHDLIDEGIYISRIDGDVTTYDLRTRKPNAGEYMDNLTMHSVEHMAATYIRNSKIGERVVYFGPMGCQTGFYLLVRDSNNAETLEVLLDVLRRIAYESDAMVGNTREECGNYKNLSIDAARQECKRYLEVLLSRENDFKYRTESEHEG